MNVSFFGFCLWGLGFLVPDVLGVNVRVDLSAEEILKLADVIVAKSKKIHDAVASLPLDKVRRIPLLFKFFSGELV